MTTQRELLDLAIQKIGNRYLTTMLIAKRIRQLHHGQRPCVPRQEGESHFSVAVREIAEGLITLEASPPSPPAPQNGTPPAPASDNGDAPQE